MAMEEPDYEKIIEEYEEIFVPEEFQEPSVTNTVDLAPAKASPDA
jgi:hypothetical protein